MIVICTKCKAKFRVADDRVGPRGAKVRCPRCQTVFFVHSGSGGIDALGASGVDPFGAPPAPGLDVELERPLAAGVAEAGGPPPPSPDDPFAVAGFGVALAAAPAPDPFAGAPSADPFAPAPAADPFAPGPAADPFASAARPDPFAAADAFADASGTAAGPGGPQALTDIADLLGSVPASDPVAPAARAVVPPPLPPPLPVQAPADDGGLALEDRVTPPPLASRAPLDADALLGIHSRDGFGVSDPQAFGGYELGEGPADAPLGLATPEPEPAAAAAPPEPEPAVPPPPPAPRQAPMATSAPLADRAPQPRVSRLRAVVANAIAIVALLAVALAMLVVWREGRLEAGALRPDAIRAALGAGSGPFAALEVRSGVYERERAPPLLFVRGKVVSRAAAPVRGVRISVEVIRDDAVIARGEALAGAIPTPEELYHANDAEAVVAVARTAGARAPAAVRPGEAVPFLVAIADHPSDLEGASLRVAVAEAGRRAR